MAALTGRSFVTAVDGVEVAAHDLDGHGPPLLLNHAAGFHGLALAPLARRLAGDFRCISLDGRGHGDTRLRPGQDLDWYGLAADVLAVVDGFGLDHPYGFGHSSGATAVLMAEQARPGTFRAIYCFEPVIIPAELPLGNDTGNWLAARARKRRSTFASREDALRHFAGKPPLETLDPEALRAYVDHGFEEADEGVRLKCLPENEAAVYETATGHDAFTRLGDIDCPVIVACGSLTPGCSGERPFAHEDRIPAGRRVVVDDVGHFGPLERLDLMAASIRRSLSEAAMENR